MSKLILTIGQCYRAILPDKTQITFKFLGSANNMQLLIEVDGQERFFNDLIPGWTSIERVSC